MKDNSIKCAIWLKKQNIGFNDIVAIASCNRLENYIPTFATFYVGAVHFSWNHKDNLSN